MRLFGLLMLLHGSVFADHPMGSKEQYELAKLLVGKTLYYNVEYWGFTKAGEYYSLPLLSKVRVLSVAMNAGKDYNYLPLTFILEYRNGKTIDTIESNGQMDEDRLLKHPLRPWTFYFEESSIASHWDKKTKQCYAASRICEGMREDALKILLLSVFVERLMDEDFESNNGRFYHFNMLSKRYVVACADGRVVKYLKRDKD